MKLVGKGAMVWQLRMWQGGIPVYQAMEAAALGLNWVSIKITDGCREKWEPGTTTNMNLLPATVPALRAAGIKVYAWSWLWGPKVIWDFAKGFYVQNTPKKEAAAAVAVCRKYGIEHLQINAEASYRGHREYAEAYCLEVNNSAPDIEYSLCSYRYPVTGQPDFPTSTFAPQVDAWCPQVYFLLDNRVNGGALQLVESERQYRIIKSLPYFPIAPTYPYGYKDAAGVRHEWRAKKDQLLALFLRAKADGCQAVGVWDLPQASDQQKLALKEFSFGTAPPPSPAQWLVVVAGNLRTLATTNAPVIRLLPVGTVVAVLETGFGAAQDWKKIQAGPEIGYFWDPGYKLQPV